MGEVLPNAIMLMAKSAKDAGLTTNGTVKEMMALQQTGGLISSKVLPHFARNMSEAARANGGLNKAMDSNRVAMARMILSLREAADIVFRSDFGTGLTELFNEVATSVVDLKELWEGLGKVFGAAFRVLAKVVKEVTPTLVAIGSVIDGITEGLGDMASSSLLLLPFSRMLITLGSRLNPLVIAFTTIATVIKDAAFWAEELVNVFTGGKIGVLNSTGKAMNFDAGLGGYFDMLSNTNAIPPALKAMGQVGNLLMPKDSSPEITVNTAINIDGEKVGNSVSKSKAVQDTINEHLNAIY